MNDCQRAKIIAEVGRKKQERDTEQKKFIKDNARLEELKTNPIVMEYLALFDNIVSSSEQYSKERRIRESTDDEIIKNVFFYHMRKNFNCKHPIRVYVSSNYVAYDFMRHERDDEYAYFTENQPQTPNRFEFLHNVYYCLECGKQCQVKNWREFERLNNVLKNQELKIMPEEISIFYYKLLMEHDVEKAQAIMTEIFNSEEVKSHGLAKKRTRDYFYVGYYNGE